MRKVVQIVLGIAIIGLAYVLFNQIMTPLRFQKTQAIREAAIIERLKDIRAAERAYKQVYQRYTGSFDTLVHFLLNDSLPFKKSIGSADDSVAVAKGLVKEETFYMRAIDTVFGAKKFTPEAIRKFEYIPAPAGNTEKFILNAGNFLTESGVIVPVFECNAPYKLFLADQDRQELINLIDYRKTINKYAGLKVGAMNAATNDAGNWE